MTNKDLIQSLKQLKSQEAAGWPKQDFIAKNREILMMQIKNSTAPKRPFALTDLGQFFKELLPPAPRFILRQAALSLAVLAVAFAAWSAVVSASSDSLPGDRLYNVKLLAERAELSLTSSKDKPSLQVELAGRRLEEMAKIAETALNNKEERTKEAVSRLSGHLTVVRTSLENADQKEPGQALEVARLIEEKSAEYNQKLETAKENVTSDGQKDVEGVSNLLLEVQNLATTVVSTSTVSQ